MKLSHKAVVLLALPLMLSACAVRQLNDGSYTSCPVGNPCQIGPQANPTATPSPMMHKHHHHHHHHMVKKAPAAAKTPAPAATSN